ncbi:MAG: hypothetical protein KatS3mg132_247 [Limisphaera sp.]|nr:MAG: hypothetical protein KatS3mg132_247 [Limisphaera sp.]
MGFIAHDDIPSPHGDPESERVARPPACAETEGVLTSATGSGSWRFGVYGPAGSIKKKTVNSFIRSFVISRAGHAVAARGPDHGLARFCRVRARPVGLDCRRRRGAVGG